MTTDDLKLLAKQIDVVLRVSDIARTNSNQDFKEPGMGTDYDCRIGEFLIKKRRNPYKGGDEY